VGLVALRFPGPLFADARRCVGASEALRSRWFGPCRGPNPSPFLPIRFLVPVACPAGGFVLILVPYYGAQPLSIGLSRVCNVYCDSSTYPNDPSDKTLAQRAYISPSHLVIYRLVGV
jgi:hypothetical protein